MAKVKVDAKTALDDIRAGMSDSALMDKYKTFGYGAPESFRQAVDGRTRQPGGTRREGAVESEVGGH